MTLLAGVGEVLELRRKLNDLSKAVNLVSNRYNKLPALEPKLYMRSWKHCLWIPPGACMVIAQHANLLQSAWNKSSIRLNFYIMSI